MLIVDEEEGWMYLLCYLNLRRYLLVMLLSFLALMNLLALGKLKLLC